ncbi:hypothetical protein MCETHM1_01595 [Flavobacteriaceae bacterium]|jgi:hypothetical protein
MIYKNHSFFLSINFYSSENYSNTNRKINGMIKNKTIETENSIFYFLASIIDRKQRSQFCNLNSDKTRLFILKFLFLHQTEIFRCKNI